MKNYQGNEFLAPLNKNLEEKILKWYPSDTKEQFEKQKNIIFYKNLYGPDDIIYKLNNYNFRCDNFKDDSYNNPYRILFMGCSFTFGIGLPLHDVWAKIMHERICTELNQDIPYWNLAWGGSGTDQMYRYLYHLGPKLRPQIIISLTSFLERRELFANNGEFLPNHKPDEVSKKEFHSYIQEIGRAHV